MSRFQDHYVMTSCLNLSDELHMVGSVYKAAFRLPANV